MSEETGLTTQLSAADTIAMLRSQGASKYSSDTALAAVTSGAAFLPYIQVMGGNSEIVKEGKFPIGHFALVKNKQRIDVGTSLLAMLLSWRPKAMQYSPDVLSYYNTETPEFKAIAERAKGQGNTGCGNGPEFFVWLPEHKELATFYFGNKSGQREGTNIVGAYKAGDLNCRFNIELVKKEKEKQSWHVAIMYRYELPIDPPPTDLLMTHLESFNNPKDSVKGEKAEAPPEGGERG